MRHVNAAAALLAVSLLAVVGCGSSLNVTDGGLSGAGGTTGSGSGCTTIQGSCRDATGLFCSEYGGLDATTLMTVRDQCTADTSEPGTWSSAGCSHAGAVGGCRVMQLAVCATVWIYIGSPAETMSACAEQSGTWVNP